MKIPVRPPDYASTLELILATTAFNWVFDPSISREPGGKYIHWDKLRHLKPPENLTHEEWWIALKHRRRNERKATPIKDTTGNPFTYGLADPIPEGLHKIDQGTAGTIAMPEAITNPETKDRYVIRSLVEEAITSSQLEGAATTREVAKEMIRTGRKARDLSERMILNNFRTMQRIGELRAKALTPSLVMEIHKLITTDTLDRPEAAGRLRLAGEDVVIDDFHGQIFHVPPPGEQLEQRMNDMCNFANGKTPGDFMHPVIRSMILHFWLAYDHPFIDGNGRTARALFYWSMLHYGYWLCEFVSISEIIRKAPAKYGRAFLYTETDDNDLTYFLIYHLGVLERGVKQLYSFVERKTKQLRELRGIVVLNHRQRTLISHALRHPQQRYTVESHRSSNGVVYETARSDLLDLAKRGLLRQSKVGRTWHFKPAENLQQVLADLG